MGVHHVAIATRDLAATHRFYTEAMGFRLVHVEAGESGDAASWFRHVFYDTGDGSLLAFFELHDDRFAGLDLSISTGLGLPPWVNHFAYTAVDLSALDAARDRWLSCGYDVGRIDHGASISIYTNDPDGNLVEWCCWTTELTAEHERDAAARLLDPDPPRNVPPDVEFFLAADFVAAAR